MISWLWGSPTAEVHGPVPSLLTEIPACRGLLVPIFQVSPGLLVLPHLPHEVTQKLQCNILWEMGCFLRLYTYTLSQPPLNHIWAVPYCLATVINTGLLEGISSCLSYTLSTEQQAPGTWSSQLVWLSDSPPFSHLGFFYLKVGGDPDRTSICPLAFTLPSPLLDCPGTGRTLSSLSDPISFFFSFYLFWLLSFCFVVFALSWDKKKNFKKMRKGCKEGNESIERGKYIDKIFQNFISPSYPSLNSITS